MPYLMIQTNVQVDAPDILMIQASKLVAELLNKPERYVMVAIQDNQNMMFAGQAEVPLVYMELKSIGLPEQQTADLSKALTDFVQARLNIDADRVYIEFANAERHLWGWNGGTF